MSAFWKQLFCPTARKQHGGKAKGEEAYSSGLGDEGDVEFEEVAATLFVAAELGVGKGGGGGLDVRPCVMLCHANLKPDGAAA
jgi:hypothetical protein